MFIKKAEESDIKNIVELHKYSYDFLRNNYSDIIQQ